MKYGLCVLLFSTQVLAAIWTVDASHSGIIFKIRHLVVSNVTGSLSFKEGAFNLDDTSFLKAKMEATIDANSITTNHAKRDKHLREPDFLNVAKYPVIKFVSKKVEAQGARYKVIGDLTLHGVTKEITLDTEGISPPINDPWGNTRRGFSATTRFNRKDFGIVWNKVLETGGLTLGEELDVSVEMEVFRKIEKQPASRS